MILRLAGGGVVHCSRFDFVIRFLLVETCCALFLLGLRVVVNLRCGLRFGWRFGSRFGLFWGLVLMD